MPQFGSSTDTDIFSSYSEKQRQESIYRTIYIRKEYAAQIEKLAVRHGISWNRAAVLILQSYLDGIAFDRRP